MAFKLTKEEISKRDTLLNELQEGWSVIETAHEEVLAAIQELLQEFNIKVETFQGIASNADAFRDEVAARLREEWDNKSEGWQNGEKGTDAAAFVEEWENATFDFGVDIPEVDLYINGGEDLFGILEALPVEVGS